MAKQSSKLDVPVSKIILTYQDSIVVNTTIIQDIILKVREVKNVRNKSLYFFTIEVRPDKFYDETSEDYDSPIVCTWEGVRRVMLIMYTYRGHDYQDTGSLFDDTDL